MLENFKDWTISSQDLLKWVRFRDYSVDTVHIGTLIGRNVVNGQLMCVTVEEVGCKCIRNGEHQ